MTVFWIFFDHNSTIVFWIMYSCFRITLSNAVFDKGIEPFLKFDHILTEKNYEIELPRLLYRLKNQCFYGIINCDMNAVEKEDKAGYA